MDSCNVGIKTSGIITGNIGYILKERLDATITRVSIDDEKVSIWIDKDSCRYSNKIDLRSFLNGCDGIVDRQWFTDQNPSELKIYSFFDRGDKNE